MADRKLTCEQAVMVVEEFLAGETVKRLAKRFNITRPAVMNLLMRRTYLECFDPLDWFPSERAYFDTIKLLLSANLRRARGRGARR